MAERYLKVTNKREKQRNDQLRQRSHVIKQEVDQANDITLSQHRTAKQLALIRKYQDGLFNNRVTSLSPRQSRNLNAYSVDLPENANISVGFKSPQLGGLITERQISHMIDQQGRKTREQQKKQMLKQELETQMQEKIFRREMERLYMDEKSIATSKGLIRGTGVNVA